MTINFWASGNFVSTENIRRKYNTIVDLSKFTFNKKILKEIVFISYNKAWFCQLNGCLDGIQWKRVRNLQNNNKDVSPFKVTSVVLANKSSVKMLDVEREIIRTKNMFQCVFVPFFFLDVEVVYRLYRSLSFWLLEVFNSGLNCFGNAFDGLMRWFDDLANSHFCACVRW